MAEKPEPQIVQVPKGWLSSEEAAKVLNIQPGVIRILVKAGKLDKGYIGKSLFVTVQSVDRYAATRGPRQGGRPKKVTT